MEGDGGKGLALVLHLDALFGFNGLVQTLVVATTQHNTTGEFVYDQHLTVLDHIVNIPAHNADGLDGLVNVVQQGGVLNIHQVVYMEVGFRFLHAVLGQGGGAGLLVYDKVAVIGGLGVLLLVHFGNLYHLQGAGEGVGLAIQIGGLLALTADDQGGTGLIDQNGVYLIYDGKHMAALHLLLLVLDHVVSQIVKAHLIVGAVGDVAVVGLLALLIGLFVNDQAYAQPQEPVQLAHPLGVTLGQVVVDGDNVYAAAGQSVQISGQGRHKGFTFTGFHLRNTALVQYNAADDLDGEVLHTQHTPGSLTADGKCVRQNVVQSLAVRQPGF